MEPALPDYIRESVRSLPPLPEAVQRLLTLSRDADVDFREVARVIETDQTLTARTLRAANSAFYGVPRQIDTVRQAAVLLGSDAIINLVIGVSVLGLQDAMKQRWPFEPAAFWRHTLAVATAARTLAGHVCPDDADSAFVAGLLHDIGKLILLEHFGDVYAQVLMAARETHPLHELEREILDVDHALAGYALCKHWNLPATLTNAVAEHHGTSAPSPNSIPDLVRDANELVKYTQIGEGGNPFVAVPNGTHAPHTQLPPHVIDELLRTLPQAVCDAEEVFGRPGSKLPAIPATGTLVHLEITQPGERQALALALRTRGYAVQLLNEGGALPSAADLTLAGLITDLPITPPRTFAYERHQAPIIDYNAWRSTTDVADLAALHTGRLQAWLQTELCRVNARAA